MAMKSGNSLIIRLIWRLLGIKVPSRVFLGEQAMPPFPLTRKDNYDKDEAST